MKKIIYLANNDGSDTRIYKEVKTLSKSFKIIYIGVLKSKSNDSASFSKKYCYKFILNKGSIRNPKTILKIVFSFFLEVLKHKVESIHIVNEQMLFLVYPICFFKRSILDQFDSIFNTKLNFIGDALFLKRIIYYPIEKIIVPDSNRLSLLPHSTQNKAVIIPNYPFYRKDISKINSSSDELIILYFGWLGKNRGSYTLKGLLDTGENIKIISAGWFADNYTKTLFDLHKNSVHYHGVLHQKEALNLSKNANYILCVYNPMNLNNINASPNKVYDAIQVQRPLITNSEVNISKFVSDNNLGIIIPEYNVRDYHQLFNELIEKKNTFKFDLNLRREYCWENKEMVLLNTHK